MHPMGILELRSTGSPEIGRRDLFFPYDAGKKLPDRRSCAAGKRRLPPSTPFSQVWCCGLFVGGGAAGMAASEVRESGEKWGA